MGVLLLSVLPASILTACLDGQPVQQRINEGRTVYLNNCSRCHQSDGQGFRSVYPNLAGNPIVILHDANPTIETVLEGRGGMPGFRYSLDPDELAQVVSYIRSAWGNDASPVTASQMK